MSRTSVYLFGCFDLIHPGHLNIMRESKKLGDHLIVGIISDEGIRSKKGEDRPVQDYATRLLMVEALAIADEVVLQPEYDPTSVLKQLKPDILVHGDDWDHVTGQEWMEANGGKLVKIPYTKGHSTTDLVNKMLK